jgi:thiol-disulfide isomerase/thioredoxin
MYAPWCGHCKTVKPVLENFVHPEATIAMIDCTKNEQTCDRFKVKSYPTIVRFVKGTYWPHKGKRTAEDFWNFLNGNYKKEKE